MAIGTPPKVIRCDEWESPDAPTISGLQLQLGYERVSSSDPKQTDSFSALMRTLLLPLLFLASFCLPSTLLSQTEEYSWTTIAGLAGTSGNADGTNSQARFNDPGGI